MTDEKKDIDRKDSLRWGRLFFEGYLAHLNAAACYLSYSKRWARRGSGGKDSHNGAYRSEGPFRHNTSYIFVISKVFFEDTKI